MERTGWQYLPLETQKALANIYNSQLSSHEREAALSSEMGRLCLTGTVGSLQRNIRFFNTVYASLIKDKASQIRIPEPTKRVYLDYEVIQSDNFLVLSDIEVPNQNQHMLKLALLDAMANDVRTTIWNGDIVATDYDALNQWVATWKERQETTYDDDRNAVIDLGLEFGKQMDFQYATEGNHDDRIARATAGNVHLGMLVESSGIKYSRYSYMYVETSRGFVRVVHPSSFSSNPVVLAQDMYNAERGPHYPKRYDKCHYVIGHCHRAQWGFSPEGRMEMHATGMMRDDLRTQYKMKSANKHKQWDPGYFICIDGYFYNRTLRGTNWKKVLGDLYTESPVYLHADELPLAI